jgi:formimidoylglutamate deiminase
MYRACAALGPEELYIASRQAFVEMALAGITSVGEFHYLHRDPVGNEYADRNELANQVIRAAREVGLRIALLRAAYARAGFQLPDDARQLRFLEPEVEGVLTAVQELSSRWAADPCVSIGIAPHSVRAVPREWLRVLAQERGRVLHMHVSEQLEEVEQCLEEHGRRPVELLDELGFLGPHFTAVHAIQLNGREIERLGRTRSNVCACPSTEQDLGDGVVPADTLMEEGVPISLGSDSQARIDLLAEARDLEGHLRLMQLRRAVLDPGSGDNLGLSRTLFACASGNGARSLGLQPPEPKEGAPSDSFRLDLSHPSLAGAGEKSLLASIVFGAEKGAIRDVWVGSNRIVQDGHHRLEEESGREFTALCRRIFD